MEKVLLCKIDELTANKGILFSIKEKEVVAFLTAEGVSVVERLCPHYNAPLETYGSISEGKITCNLHRYTFSADNGVYQGNPSRCRNLKVFESHIEAESVFIMV